MDENKVELLENTEKQETNLPVPVENTEKPIEDKKPKKKGGRRKTDKPTEEVTDFEQLALLMNSTVEELKDEFFLFQIRKLMSKMAKTIVRFGVSDGNLAKIFQNAKTTGLDSVVVAPTYLSACEKQVDKIDGYKVGSILDFPFGESALKSKITGIADCRRWDVDEVTVMMPSAMLTKENKRLFKKQVLKLGKKYRGHVGIGLNATDLSEEKIERATKIVSASKAEFITYVFGAATLEEVRAKMKVVKKFKSKKKVFVFANVEHAEVVTELFRLGVDKILTPYADDIAKDLFKKFNIKGAKLV